MTINKLTLKIQRIQSYESALSCSPRECETLLHKLCYVISCGITKCTVGGIALICFKQWFQITADAHPGVSGVSKDQKFCEKFKNTHCQVDHPAKME